jgi:hypothetical protein
MLHTCQNLTGVGPVKFASGHYIDDAGRPVPGAGDGLPRLHEQDPDGIDADITETPALALSA